MIPFLTCLKHCHSQMVYYCGLRKQPDALLHIPLRPFPTLVAEIGWSELYDDLLDDMNRLLVGGDGAIKVVILVKWTMHANNKVSGVFELYKNDRQGIPRCTQREVDFPMPTGDPPQPLDIRRASCTLFSLLAIRTRKFLCSLAAYATTLGSVLRSRDTCLPSCLVLCIILALLHSGFISLWLFSSLWLCIFIDEYGIMVAINDYINYDTHPWSKHVPIPSTLARRNIKQAPYML